MPHMRIPAYRATYPEHMTYRELRRRPGIAIGEDFCCRDMHYLMIMETTTESERPVEPVTRLSNVANFALGSVTNMTSATCREDDKICKMFGISSAERSWFRSHTKVALADWTRSGPLLLPVFGFEFRRSGQVCDEYEQLVDRLANRRHPWLRTLNITACWREFFESVVIQRDMRVGVGATGEGEAPQRPISRNNLRVCPIFTPPYAHPALESAAYRLDAPEVDSLLLDVARYRAVITLAVNAAFTLSQGVMVNAAKMTGLGGVLAGLAGTLNCSVLHEEHCGGRESYGCYDRVQQCLCKWTNRFFEPCVQRMLGRHISHVAFFRGICDIMLQLARHLISTSDNLALVHTLSRIGRPAGTGYPEDDTHTHAQVEGALLQICEFLASIPSELDSV